MHEVCSTDSHLPQQITKEREKIDGVDKDIVSGERGEGYIETERQKERERKRDGKREAGRERQRERKTDRQTGQTDRQCVYITIIQLGL